MQSPCLDPLPAGSISGLVWNDTNDNGLQDSGEASREGVTVYLYDSSGNLLDAVGTDENGAYEFDYLPAGDYHVTFGAPVNDGFATQDAGSDDTLDSDADTAGTTATFTLGTDEAKAHVDAGLVLTASSVQGYVWDDADGDGIQGPLEPGRASVLVHLCDSNFTPIASVFTDSSGHYQFTGVAPGNYSVRFDMDPDSGEAFSPKDQGSDTLDSDVVGSAGYTDLFTLLANELVANLDAGYVPVSGSP